VERNIGPRIIVQGGVYRDMETDTKDEYKRATKQSAKEGYAVLMSVPMELISCLHTCLLAKRVSLGQIVQEDGYKIT
jgi:hypothetical protein